MTLSVAQERIARNTARLSTETTFPEGYRILTTYPDTRPPEVDARGNRQP